MVFMSRWLSGPGRERFRFRLYSRSETPQGLFVILSDAYQYNLITQFAHLPLFATQSDRHRQSLKREWIVWCVSLAQSFDLTVRVERMGTRSRKPSCMRRARCVPELTTWRNVRRSNAQRLTSVTAVTVAARGLLYISDSSPKLAPGPRCWTLIGGSPITLLRTCASASPPTTM